MRSRNFVESIIWTIVTSDEGSAVLLRPLQSQNAVPIYIGKLEIQAILVGMGRVSLPRPLTHDLYLTTLNELNAEIEKIEIYHNAKNVFYAHIYARRGNKRLILDSRPSDALSIAVRTNCPIYIAENVVRKSGIPTELIEEVTSSSTALEDLKHQLELEIEQENYENAAKIRDQISDIEKSIHNVEKSTGTGKLKSQSENTDNHPEGDD